MPPAAKRGIFRPNSSSKTCNTESTSGISSSKGLAVASSTSAALKPKCPPAKGPSSTTKSAVLWYFWLQVLSKTLAALPLETIGAIKAVPSGTSSGKLRGNPAPEITASIPSSTATFMASPHCLVATMALMAIIPFPSLSTFALWISFRKARRLASSGKRRKSSSL